MSYLREIVESIKMADWHSFNAEAAAMHIFMATTRDEEAKRACYKILTELPQGDVEMLMTKITAIEAFPEHKPPASVKPIISKPEFKIHVNGRVIWSRNAGANVSIVASLATKLRFAAISPSQNL